MCQRAKICIIAVLLLAVFSARAAGGAAAPIPLLDGGNLLLVPVQAFHKTLYFIADTGFTVSAIDIRYQPFLGRSVDTYRAISPLGTKKDVPIFRCPRLAIAGHPLDLKLIAGLDLKMLRLITGEECDGILGMDWFARNVITVNFDAGTLSVNGPPPVAGPRQFIVPLLFTNGFYAMNARLNQDHRLRLMIDTGDSSSLSLNDADWSEIFPTPQTNTVLATVADAVNRISRAQVGVVRRVTVQGLDYTNLHAMFMQNSDQPSRLGLGLFRRHNVTFDFAGLRLYLSPDKNFTTPDVEDMSGLHLLRHGVNTIVHSVDNPSPAADRGLRPNDIIVAVNGQPAGALKINVIRQILRSRDGTPVALQIRRGGHVQDIRLILKQTI